MESKVTSPAKAPVAKAPAAPAVAPVAAAPPKPKADTVADLTAQMDAKRKEIEEHKTHVDAAHGELDDLIQRCNRVARV